MNENVNYFGVYFPSWPRPVGFTVILPFVPNFWLVACIIFSLVDIVGSLSPCWLFRRLLFFVLLFSMVHTFITASQIKTKKMHSFSALAQYNMFKQLQIIYLESLVAYPFSHICQQPLLWSFYLYSSYLTYCSPVLIDALNINFSLHQEKDT